MEKTAHAAVLLIDVGWNDVGSWSALWQVAEQDGEGNAHHGDVIARDCRNTLAWGNGRLVALLGLENVVVVDTADAVLVAHKDKVQDVKEIVASLKLAGRSEPTLHRKVTVRGAVTTPSTWVSASRSSALPSSLARHSACRCTNIVPNTGSW